MQHPWKSFFFLLLPHWYIKNEYLNRWYFAVHCLHRSCNSKRKSWFPSLSNRAWMYNTTTKHSVHNLVFCYYYSCIWNQNEMIHLQWLRRSRKLSVRARLHDTARHATARQFCHGTKWVAWIAVRAFTWHGAGNGHWVQYPLPHGAPRRRRRVV